MSENEQSSAGGEYRNGNPVLQAKDWIACGRRLVLQQQSLWYGMAAVYIVLGFLLTLIPFMGHLLLILITPMLLAGVIWGRTQERQVPPAPSAEPVPSAQKILQEWIAQPAQELMCIFTQEGKMFGAVLLGIVTLGLVMVTSGSGWPASGSSGAAGGL